MDEPRVKVTRDAILQLIAMLDDEDDEKLKLDMLEAETPLFDLIQLLLGGIEDDEGRFKALSDQVNIRKLRMDRIEQRIANRKDIIRSLMETAGVKKIPLPEATVWTSTRQPTPKVNDLEALPEGCFTEVTTTKRVANWDGIEQSIKDGVLPDGVTIPNVPPSLNIRRK